MFNKSRRHIRRYREVARILAKHGWGWMLQRIGLGDYIGRHVKLEPYQDTPVHVRQMLEELGATFVKLGQILSTRPDIIPEAYIAELSKLQDNTPKVPALDIRAVVESEFNKKIDDLFSCFDDEPLAAASLAQVHRAKLKNGTPVIVKVLRPGIRDQVETDIEILFGRVQFLMHHYEPARDLGLMDLADEFATTIREEMDYTREARNTDRLRTGLAEEKKINVPAVHWDLTTSCVLTLEEMQGIKITDALKNPPPGADLKKMANTLASSFLKQIFVDGFFHADPHPGNILVGVNGEISLLDCGQTGRMDATSRTATLRMLIAFEQQDSRMLADEILQLGFSQEDVDVRVFTADLGKVLRSFYDVPSSSINMGQLLIRVLHVAASHKVRLPTIFAVLGKVLTNVDGICRQLDADFNFTEVARHYVGKAVRSELGSENTLAEFYQTLVSTRNFLFALPENLERIMRKIVDGTLRVEFKHQGLDSLSEGFRNGANRISIALIVGAMIVGSSLIVAVGKGSTSWFGLPTIGIAGYLIATVFGAWLVISILWPRKRK